MTKNEAIDQIVVIFIQISHNLFKGILSCSLEVGGGRWKTTSTVQREKSDAPSLPSLSCSSSLLQQVTPVCTGQYNIVCKPQKEPTLRIV